MSSNTKIIVLKSKELIYTGIFIVLGILLILLLFYMFSPGNKKDKTSNTAAEESSATVTSSTTYKPGIYTSELNLGGSSLILSVAVDNTQVSHIDISNLDETVTAMYPLIEPSLEEINAQISSISSLDDITYSSDNQYTTIIIMESVKEALEPAVIQ